MFATPRLRAFGFHLLASACIGALSASLVYLLWYPRPLDGAAGVNAIFLMLLAVDVIIGPLITLSVFDVRKRKEELRRDMLIVCALQLSALLYGMHAVFIARPVYLVYSVDRFEMVFANDLTEDKLAKVKAAEFSAVPLGRPRFAATVRPEDGNERMRITMGAIAGGDDLAQLPEHYVPYDNQASQAAKRAQPLAKLEAVNPRDLEAVGRVIRQYESTPGGVGFVPVRGKVRDLSAVLSLTTGKVLEIVDLKPWD